MTGVACLFSGEMDYTMELTSQATGLPFETKLGWMAFAFGPWGLDCLTFDHHSPRAAQIGLQQLARTRVTTQRASVKAASELSTDEIEHWSNMLYERLCAYADGSPVTFDDVPLYLSRYTHFQQQVYTACRHVPAGTTLTYSELATRVGSPLAARAIGNAMSRNRIPLVIPCHRVVGTHGSLGGFSSSSGLTMKRRLLAMEEGSGQ